MMMMMMMMMVMMIMMMMMSLKHDLSGCFLFVCLFVFRDGGGKVVRSPH